jgi:hypothetical protein
LHMTCFFVKTTSINMFSVKFDDDWCNLFDRYV